MPVNQSSRSAMGNNNSAALSPTKKRKRHLSEDLVEFPPEKRSLIAAREIVSVSPSGILFLIGGPNILCRGAKIPPL